MELNIYIGQKIKEFRTKAKMTQSDLASALDTTKQTISRYEKGDRKAGQDTLFALCDIFNVSIDDFFPAIHSAHAPDTLVQAINDTVIQLEEPRQEKVLTFADNQLKEQETEPSDKMIEFNDELEEYHAFEKLSAGNGYNYLEDRNYDIVYYDKYIPHDLASWVYGDSMEPNYPNGSVALIKDTGWDYDGAVYAVDWDGQSYIKKVYKEKDGLRLVSLNDKYADKFAPFSEEPRIIGKVVGNFMPMDI
ncbi:XRE family transcriptional regulator [Streptococcus anginosus]|uniref:XRE family transcriptional regulator n=1 Tax=Streptococcus anginosus TaxID=1328 RepID=UPI0021F87A88|nr:XRE family transcriptional regulator [Streptococcus anginosus]MCW0924606.1 XRE family transcriptional regulator [Streptococcus anginosus]MED5789129.1 XRE family transcriptional regulator [Streptococcus anginosus]MED5805792.1 XRE family transcriptional regulator [Streptococcus anginosus]MED5825278.1 XRE family transcriptional regulator [Streptococcus anginosus]MED5853096.1 XRE family transcriptional regulator [Streptococcus anginosus]